ncbi:MAG: GGDEF domain-containing protein [Planctomycetes bacterium]|nr:GGDEF domain-containing protein [Planctomycetota bacterium]MCB9886681.1 GGDEF domain-containing protein [Planctomycetota bacterium]
MLRSWRERVIDWAADAPTWLMTLVVAASVVVFTCADLYSGAEVATSLGYMLPISLAAWCLGRVPAAVTATSCALLWLGVDIKVQGSALDTTNELINLTVLFVVFMLFGQLLAALRQRLDQEHQLAHTDPLTALHNLRAFRSAADRELERCRRYGDPFTIAYFDLDNFKSVNDRYGHARGDELLRLVAQAMRKGLRRLDMAARLGGDEFALLLPGTEELGAVLALNRLLRTLHGLRTARNLGVGFSVGCLTVLEAPESVDALIARADQLMYEMKGSDRGSVRHEVLGVRRRDKERPRRGDDASSA